VSAPKPESGRKLFYGLFIFPLLILAGMIIMVVAAVVLTHEQETPEALVAAIKTGSERKRWQKAGELANELNRRKEGLRDEALLGEVLAMFADRKGFDERTRAYLALALARFDDPVVSRTLRQAVREESGEVRFYALWALGTVGDRSAAPDILPLLTGKDEDLRVTAAYVLGALGDPAAVPELTARLGDPSVDMRWNAALALARLGDAGGRDVLEKMADRRVLREEHGLDAAHIESVMLNAIKGLALIPKPESIKILKSLSREDESLKVRQAALDAVRFLETEPKGN